MWVSQLICSTNMMGMSSTSTIGHYYYLKFLKCHMSLYSSNITACQLSRLLSTWMKGKSSPTVKLESQLTVPAIMNAAGLCDCWKSSPVRTKGIPPETESNKTVTLVKSPSHQQRWASLVMHSSMTSTALQLSAGTSETDLSKSYFREVTIPSFMPSHVLFYIFSTMTSR